MTCDRASAVTATLIAVLARCLHGTDAHKEIAAVLREEFLDIQQQTLSEMRPDDPPN